MMKPTIIVTIAKNTLRKKLIKFIFGAANYEIN